MCQHALAPLAALLGQVADPDPPEHPVLGTVQHFFEVSVVLMHFTYSAPVQLAAQIELLLSLQNPLPPIEFRSFGFSPAVELSARHPAIITIVASKLHEYVPYLPWHNTYECVKILEAECLAVDNTDRNLMLRKRK